MPLSSIEHKALASLDEQGLIKALRDLVRIPSATGQEAAAQNWLAQQMRHFGLDVDLWDIDVAELQRHPQFPGMEVDRSKDRAVGLVATWRREAGAASSGRRLVFNGHIDVVPEGDRASWQHEPWGADLVEGRIYG